MKMISQMQKEVKNLRKHNKWKTRPQLLLLAMQEELGELTASFLEYKTKYRKNSKKKPHSLEEEIGDLLHLVLAFADKLGIDAEKALKKTNKKIRK